MNFYGQAKQGDRTAEAEDGRKTEQSSAAYTEAYLPRSASTCLDLGWISFQQKKKKHAVLILVKSITHGRSVYFSTSTTSDTLKNFLSLTKQKN